MPVLAFGEFELDLQLYALRRDGSAIGIAPRAFDVLAYLVRHRDHTVSKDELAEQVWGVKALSTSSVPTCIAAIRSALGDDPEAPAYVETIRRRGYRFIAKVREGTDGESVEHLGVSSRTLTERARSFAFVGRASELDALCRAFEEVSAGNARLVLVSGEAGIGKTRLVEEFLPIVEPQAAGVLIGRCAEGEGPPALWPWVQIVREIAGRADALGAREAINRYAPVLAQIVPELASEGADRVAPSHLASAEARFRQFDTVAMFLREAVEQRPWVFVLEDLHRADVASLLLLLFLARELHRVPVLFVGTYRDADLQQDASRVEILSELAREEIARCIQLVSLRREDVGAFVASALATGAASESLAGELYEQSGGNPFFLTLLMHLIGAEGRLVDPLAASQREIALPSGVREAVVRQLDGLPKATREVLSAAAVAGREFAVAPLALAMERREEDVLATLEPAMRARLLMPVFQRPGRYLFAHVLLRDCVYEELDTLVRARTHRRLGEALEELYAGDLDPRSSELAHHFLEATAIGTAEKAVHYSVRAAEWATARLSYEEVPGLLIRALEVLDPRAADADLRHCEVLLALGEAELRAGARNEAKKVLTEAARWARRLHRPELQARAALSLAPGFFAIEVGVFDPDLVALLEEAIVAIGDREPVVRAKLLSRLTDALSWSGGAADRREGLSREAVDLARVTADAEALAHALIARHGVLWAPEKWDERIEVIDELGELVERQCDVATVLMYRLLRITALLEEGDVDGVDEHAAAFRQIAERTRQPRYLWYCDLFRAMRALMMGRFEEADRYAKALLVMGQKAEDVNALHSFAAHFAIRGWENDDGVALLHQIDELVARYPDVLAWRSARGFFNSELGRPSEARRDYEVLAARSFEQIPRNESWLIAVGSVAELACSLGDEQRAEVLYRMLLPHENSFCRVAYAVAFWGSLSRQLGRLAAMMSRWETSRLHFENALRQDERVGAIPWVAHTCHHYARMLIERGRPEDRSKAVLLINRGLELAERLGMIRLGKKLRQLRDSVEIASSSDLPAL